LTLPEGLDPLRFKWIIKLLTLDFQVRHRLTLYLLGNALRGLFEKYFSLPEAKKICNHPNPAEEYHIDLEGATINQTPYGPYALVPLDHGVNDKTPRTGHTRHIRVVDIDYDAFEFILPGCQLIQVMRISKRRNNPNTPDHSLFNWKIRCHFFDNSN
jgi:hypothetical protein